MRAPWLSGFGQCSVPGTCLAPSGDGVHEGVVEASHGQDYLFVLDGGTALPDPCSRFQPEGLKGPSRIVDTSLHEIAAGPELDPAELVIYELHVGTFSDEGTCDGADPHLPRPARARRDGDRAHARRHLPRQPRLGLRRRLPLRRPPRLRRPGRPRPPRRRRAPRRPRGDPRRGLQPPRPGLGRDHRLRPLRHRPARDALGRRDRLLAAGSPRVGDPERGACGSTTSASTASASTPSSRSSTTARSTSSPSSASGFRTRS